MVVVEEVVVMVATWKEEEEEEEEEEEDISLTTRLLFNFICFDLYSYIEFARPSGG